MMSLAEFIEKYGTHPAQELLDLIFINDMKISQIEARDMLVRWKVITRRTKFIYKFLVYREWAHTYHLEFSNTTGFVLRLSITTPEIESLRATIYKRGEEQIA